MESIIIDNCVISRMVGNGARGVCIRSVRLAQTLNPNLNINSLPRRTYGSKRADNYMITQLASGALRYDDVLNL